MTDHRADALRYLGYAMQARGGEDSIADATTGTLHALLAIHDLLDKRLPKEPGSTVWYTPTTEAMWDGPLTNPRGRVDDFSPGGFVPWPGTDPDLICEGCGCHLPCRHCPDDPKTSQNAAQEALGGIQALRDTGAVWGRTAVILALSGASPPMRCGRPLGMCLAVTTRSQGYPRPRSCWRSCASTVGTSRASANSPSRKAASTTSASGYQGRTTRQSRCAGMTWPRRSMHGLRHRLVAPPCPPTAASRPHWTGATMPATDPVQAVAETLRKSRMTWGTHSDRWADAEWQDEFWTEVAEIAVAAARPLIEREDQAAALVRVRRYAEGHAITAKANGRDDRAWLDLLIILDQIEADR